MLPSLSFNGLHPRNPCNYVDYYSFTDFGGMEGWVGLVGWPIADTSPIGCGLSPHPQNLTHNQTAVHSPDLPFNVFHPRNSWITTHLPTPEGWKAELVWRSLYPRNGYMSTIDQAQIRDSPPAKDWRPNHWAAPPTIYVLYAFHLVMPFYPMLSLSPNHSVLHKCH